MASSTIYDVERALVALLGEAFVGNSTTFRTTMTPSAAEVDGVPVLVRIYPGSPNPDEMKKQVASAIGAHIVVRVESGMTRNGGARSRTWKVQSRVPATVETIINGNAVTISGTPTAGQLVGVQMDKTGWTHRCVEGDTANSVAAGLAALVPNATVTGATLTMPTLHPVNAGVATDSVSYRELGTVTQAFCIDVFASSPDVREAVAGVIPTVLLQTRSLELPYGPPTSEPVLLPIFNDDKPQTAGVWKYTHRIEVKYSTVETQVTPGILHLGFDNGGLLSGHFHPNGPIT